MLKRNFTAVAILSSLSGCSMLQSTPIPEPQKNARVVERDLKLALPGKSLTPRITTRTLAATEPNPEGGNAKPVSPQTLQLLKEADAARRAAVEVASQTPKPKQWEVLATDIKLAATFDRWAKESAEMPEPVKYKILWDADKHVLIEATPTYSGSILDAIQAALETPAIRKSKNPLEACLYENNPPVIRITKLGEQADACPEFK
jgi:hypothetical protein